MLVDPPSGWRYGFPKVYSKKEHGDLGQFLVDNGYPLDDLDFALRHCRFIGDPEEFKENEQ